MVLNSGDPDGNNKVMLCAKYCKREALLTYLAPFIIGEEQELHELIHHRNNR